MKEALKIREGVPSATRKADIMVCGGQGCISSKCGEVVDALKAALQKNNLTDKDVNIILTGCLGPCDMGPVMIVYPDATFYRKVKPKDAEAIVEEHILKGTPVQKLLYKAPGAKEATPSFNDIDLFKKQLKIVLRNNNFIDPLSIEDYVGRDGYVAPHQGPQGNDPRHGGRDRQGFRPARPRRRRILHRHEVGLQRCGEGFPQVRGLQR